MFAIEMFNQMSTNEAYETKISTTNMSASLPLKCTLLNCPPQKYPPLKCPPLKLNILAQSFQLLKKISDT